MKKAFVPLALALALAVPFADAARRDGDVGTLPFDAHQLSPARDIAAVGGLEHEGGYRTLVVGAAVPGAKSAQCSARLLDTRFGLIEEARFSVEAGSTGQIDFAGRVGKRVAAGAQISCDQPFYSYGAAAGTGDKKVTWGEDVGPNGACNFTIDAVEFEPGIFLAGKEGVIHNADKGHEKGIVCMHVPRDLNVARMVLEWDVAPGPWNKRMVSGNHNLMYLHRGRFRSNTVSNVNAFGPGKGFVKMAQNVDMAKLTNTNTKMGALLQQGSVYHFRYTYDAPAKTVTLELFNNGTLLNTSTMGTAPKSKMLIVTKAGLSPKGALFSEFGHNRGQHPPEMDSPGWRYGNLRVEMKTASAL
ncbi:MAG TPA: hypothetical protein VNM67_12600 [Thermoanaerobaculia bacterium]|jgi:hypothetical protein|nr:hypothetical protein [Thermoanaerobaculia bacterium]